MDPLQRAFAEMDRADAQARTYYRVLREQRKLSSVARAELRCSRGCALLIVFETPAGPAFYQKRYKLSPDLNASTSSEAGRLTNTEDGENHWKERGGMLTSALNFTLECDHVHGLVVERDDLELGQPGKAARRVVS